MLADCETAVSQTLNQIITRVWQGVAIANIQKRLAPTCARLDFMEYLGSHVQNAAEPVRQPGKMERDNDPANIELDNFTYGAVQREDRQDRLQGGRTERNNTEAMSVKRSGKFTLQSSRHEGKQSRSSQMLVTLPQEEDLHYVMDPDEDKCRSYILNSQRQLKETKKFMETKVKERSENSIRKKKLIRDLKKFTFDFDGNFVGVGAKEGIEGKRMIKIQKRDGQQQVVGKETANPESRSIENQKIKQRQAKLIKQTSKDKEDKTAPMFDQKRPQSLVDLFESESKISEGIKLVGEKGNQKVIRQKPRRKLSGMKQYGLSQFQNVTRNKRFSDHKKPLLNRSAATLDIDKTLNSVEQQKYQQPISKTISHGQNRQSLNENIEGYKLPPLRSTHNKQKSMGLGKFAGPYIKSSRFILEESSFSTQKSRQSRIKIDDDQLYTQNFTINAEQ